MEADTLTVDGNPSVGVIRTAIDSGPVEYVRSLGASLPDPNWSVRDSHGHEHKWAKTGRGVMHRSDALPTLTASLEHQPCDGSCGGVCEGEGYHITVWHCVICGERVAPGFIPDMEARTSGVPVRLGPAVLTLTTDAAPYDHGSRSPVPGKLSISGRDEMPGQVLILETRTTWSVEGAETECTVEFLPDAWAAGQ